MNEQSNFTERVLGVIGDGGNFVVARQGKARQTTTEAEGTDTRLTISGPARVDRIGQAEGVTLEPGARATLTKSWRRGPVTTTEDPRQEIALALSGGDTPQTREKVVRLFSGTFTKPRLHRIPVISSVATKLLGPAEVVTTDFSNQELEERTREGWKLRGKVEVLR